MVNQVQEVYVLPLLHTLWNGKNVMVIMCLHVVLLLINVRDMVRKNVLKVISMCFIIVRGNK